MSPIDLPDLSGVEAWKGGGGPPPDGWHDFRIEEPELRTTGNGNPQIKWRLTAVAGPAVGTSTSDFVVITNGSLGKVKGIMESAGMSIPQGDFRLDEKAFDGRVVSGLIRHEDDVNGATNDDGTVKVWARVKAYGPPKFGGAATTPAVASDFAVSAPSVAPVGGSGPSASQTDDDIPF